MRKSPFLFDKEGKELIINGLNHKHYFEYINRFPVISLPMFMNFLAYKNNKVQSMNSFIDADKDIWINYWPITEKITELSTNSSFEAAAISHSVYDCCTFKNNKSREFTLDNLPNHREDKINFYKEIGFFYRPANNFRESRPKTVSLTSTGIVCLYINWNNILKSTKNDGHDCQLPFNLDCLKMFRTYFSNLLDNNISLIDNLIKEEEEKMNKIEKLSVKEMHVDELHVGTIKQEKPKTIIHPIGAGQTGKAEKTSKKGNPHYTNGLKQVFFVELLEYFSPVTPEELANASIPDIVGFLSNNEQYMKEKNIYDKILSSYNKCVTNHSVRVRNWEMRKNGKTINDYKFFGNRTSISRYISTSTICFIDKCIEKAKEFKYFVALAILEKIPYNHIKNISYENPFERIYGTMPPDK